MTAQPISTSADWTFELLETYEREIGRIAEGFGLDTYPNQIEIISSEQMMDAYASSGMPINYHHWSFGNMPPVPGVTKDEVSSIIRYVRELQVAIGVFYKKHQM